MEKTLEQNPKCAMILVGCKEDLQSSDDPKMQPVHDWAEEENIPFFSTSAKTGGKNIKFLFTSVAEKCVRIALQRQGQSGGGSGVQLAGGPGQGATKQTG